MNGERNGITVAGNILTDIVKTVDCYPNVGMLANISDIRRGVGGCAPNTSIDLAKIDPELKLSVAGKIGDDEYGNYLLSELKSNGIDCSLISVSDNMPTSFSDVMSMPSGERTFFHARAANSEFSPADIDIKKLDCRILHIGYILLLEAFDKPDDEYGTVMARFLHDVQAAGIKTSVDVVSDSTADYKAIIVPALKYCNYIILNEVESGMISGLSPYKENGDIDTENIHKTMSFMASCGVKDKIVVHCKQAGFCLDVKTGDFSSVTSLKIPSNEIKGSVGAGDAFCAATLYGIYNDYSDDHILKFASAAAACNLFAENSTDGMLNKEQIEKMEAKYGRLSL